MRACTYIRTYAFVLCASAAPRNSITPIWSAVGWLGLGLGPLYLGGYHWGVGEGRGPQNPQRTTTFTHKREP